MLRRRGLAAAALAGLILALVIAGPGAAKTKPKYKFSFSTKLQADWQWPVNQFNHNQRDTDRFVVQSGTGCGTAPSHAIWHTTQQSGDTGQLPPYKFLIDLVHGTTKNPAPVTDANYPGTPSARVLFFLKFPKKKTGKLTLIAQPTGDVAGMTITPPVTLKAKKVKHC